MCKVCIKDTSRKCYTHLTSVQHEEETVKNTNCLIVKALNIIK